jgi:hypothetical protein
MLRRVLLPENRSDLRTTGEPPIPAGHTIFPNSLITSPLLPDGNNCRSKHPKFPTGHIPVPSAAKSPLQQFSPHPILQRQAIGSISEETLNF